MKASHIRIGGRLKYEKRSQLNPGKGPRRHGKRDSPADERQDFLTIFERFTALQVIVGFLDLVTICEGDMFLSFFTRYQDWYAYTR